MPNDILIEWIAYLEIKEERELQREIEALSIVLAQLFRKE